MTSNDSNNLKMTFRGPQPSNRDPQDIYPVNGISFHPKHHGLLATVGSDGKYSFWDKVFFHFRFQIQTGSSRVSCANIYFVGKSYKTFDFINEYAK